MTETLRHWDRRTVDAFRKRDGWIGYAEEHGIVLDFGDRLSRFSAADRLVLCLAGWVEYPYSQTNYAAATAGVALKPPAIERRRADGTLGDHRAPRRLSRRPAPADDARPDRQAHRPATASCGSRPTWNATTTRRSSPCATATAEASLRVTTLPVARAGLGYRGYTREISPDGRQPLLYDYDYVDPAPLARFSGKLTRYGDVAGLLQADDDQLCLVGPGDEVRLEFDAAGLPPLPPGWTRSYVLRSYRLLQGRRPVHGHERHRSSRSPGAGCRRSRSAQLHVRTATTRTRYQTAAGEGASVLYLRAYSDSRRPRAGATDGLAIPRETRRIDRCPLTFR